MVHIIKLIGNRKLVTILTYFLENPSAKISQKELNKKAKISKATSTKWTSFLVKEGLLNQDKIGVTKLYSLSDNILNKQLKILINISHLDALKTIGENLEIYLYGSAARGEDTENSDFDILVIGNIKREKIVADIERISAKIKKQINFQIFSQLEWSRMAVKDKPFYERVEKDKLRII